MLNEASCHTRLGQNARAKQLLQQVVEEYPMSVAADEAKIALENL